MKKISLSMALFLIASIGWAIPTNDTNIALNISKSIKTTFTNTGGCFDGVISSDEQFCAKSGDIYKQLQEIYVPLEKPFYVRQIKIYFKQGAYYENYNLQTAEQENALFTEDKELVLIEEKEGSLIHTYDIKGKLVSHLRIVIKGDNKDKIKAGPVVIQEVEVFPQMDDRVEVQGVASIITDTEAFIMVNTNIQSSNFLKFRQAGVSENFRQGGYGRLGEAASAVNLNVGTRYDYYVLTKDFNANFFEGDETQFTTKPESLAKKAVVAGTFQSIADGKSILNDGLLEIPDNSGSIYEKDQEVILDLGEIKQASTVTVLWSRLAYSKEYAVLGSEDGKEWKELAKNIDASKGLLGRSKGSVGGNPMRVVETKFAQQPVRFIKILIKKDSDFYHKHTAWNYVQIFEIKVF